MMVNQCVGGGITAFEVIPGRPKDSLGMGLGVSWLNSPPPGRDTEILTQFYYQAHLIGDLFFQPTFSYVPNPGKVPPYQQGKVDPYSGGSYPAATSMFFSSSPCLDRLCPSPHGPIRGLARAVSGQSWPFGISASFSTR